MALAGFAKKFIPSAGAKGDPSRTQFGTIPYQVIDGEVAFLMITSRRSANWVIGLKNQSVSDIGPCRRKSGVCSPAHKRQNWRLILIGALCRKFIRRVISAKAFRAGPILGLMLVQI